MTALTKEQILGADDIKTERVEVPEWGGYVLVKDIGGEGRDVFDAWRVQQSESKADDRFKNTRARLCALAICDDEGKALFSLKDVIALGKKSGTALDRVYDAASSLNGLSAESREELKKNYSPASEDSGSDSPAIKDEA
jgi:hypothetical protein